ncbi:MAG: hypothetical protein WBH14_13355 [Albidovulum sp.]
MVRPIPFAVLAGGLLTALSACAGTGTPDAFKSTPEAEPDYLGSSTVGLGGDLYSFLVTMEHPRDLDHLESYVTCVVAGYTLEKNYGFARKLRTNLHQEGGIWSADAVYTISPTLPRGLKTIDAEVTVADCTDQGIPTV